MEKVEHRIFLVGLAISCWQIHIHTAVGIHSVGVIPYRAHLTMVNVLHLIFIGNATTNVENTEHIAHIAASEWVNRVDAYNTVNIKTIGVHFRNELWSGIFPNSIYAFLHNALSAVLLPVNQYLHALCLRGIHTECDGTVVVYLWGNQFTLTKRNVLLCAHAQ